MLAFLIAGVIIGSTAWALRHGEGDPPLLLTLLVGVVGAVIGGAGLNVVLADAWRELTVWSFTGACVLAFVLLGLYEGGVGRKKR